MTFDLRDYIESEIIEPLKKSRQTQLGVALLLLAGIGTGGYFLYHYLQVRSARVAQRAFDDSIAEYERVSREQDVKKRNWAEVINSFDEAIKRHPSSGFTPAMLAYKAQAQVFANKLTEAIKTMTKAVEQVSDSSPLYYSYKTKLALMKHDSNDEATKKAGMKELEDLANTSRNTFKDEAVYYLGYFALQSGNRVKANSWWNQLLAQNEQSPWAPLVRQQFARLQNESK